MKKFILQAFPGGTSLLISEGWSAVANTITKIYINFSNVGIYALADKLSNIFSLISETGEVKNSFTPSK